VGEKAGRVDGRPINLPILDQVANLGTSVPDIIERSAIDSTDRLDRDMGMAIGLGEGWSEAIRTVNEFRVVVVPSDAVDFLS
jgi:hypothetical protein